jgi:hypothetical protein
MTASRSWNPLLGRLAAALALAALAVALGAAPAAARRNVDLSPASESAETPGSGETAPGSGGGSETPKAETPKVTPHASPSNCVVSLEGPAASNAGQAPVLKGQLTCPEAGEEAGQPVAIFERTAGTPGYAEVATATTEPDGSFSATPPPVDTNALFYARFGRSRSQRVSMRVSPLVTLAGPAHGALLPMSAHRSRSPIRFTGTVSPADTGAPVTLQRERPVGSGEWRRVAVGRVAADGSFAFLHLFRAAGPVVLRAFVHGFGHRLAAVSETLSYEVSQAQNPALTISAEPHSVALGQTVTITGKLAGHGGRTVTLSARAAGGAYTQVATATTGEDGSYTFTDTPSSTSDYRVSGNGVHSMPVRVYVTFALTATPSATTLTEGEGFTITGTLAPASPGARVFLKRAARSGVGYETLGYGTLATDSSYILEVPPAAAGTATYRVQVPGGGAGMQGTSSAPIVVTTTPAA